MTLSHYDKWNLYLETDCKETSADPPFLDRVEISTQQFALH